MPEEWGVRREWPYFIDGAADYKPGDDPPDGLIDWYGWAEVQHKAGLRQEKCPWCALWKYPQELSGETVTVRATDRKGKVTSEGVQRVCKKCVRQRDQTFWTD